jgi:protein-L-isoaspartate(D-aspartate) O-methyltransferase
MQRLESVSTEYARHFYAEELCRINHISSTAIFRAFSTVPRERFVGSGPWMIQPSGEKSFTESADPSDVYQDALIVLDAAKRLNNGQPSLWAFHLSLLDVHPGDHVLHLGCGTGYYSAILAELVGPSGRIVAIEIDQALADRARIALEPWPQVAVFHADGARGLFDPTDAIVVSAGATHPLPAWLAALKPEGKLLFPLTPSHGPGAMAYITRKSADVFGATLCGSVFFVDFEGARDLAVGDELNRALKRDHGFSVRSLRCDAHEKDESCWLHGCGWCLSRRAPISTASE